MHLYENLNKLNYFYLEKVIKDKQESLKFCILKGCCPRCLSKKLEYREILTNRKFGFKCQDCSWQDEFLVEELVQFSHRWV